MSGETGLLGRRGPGTDTARELVLTAIKNGKHIVTANKDGDTLSMVSVLKNDGNGIFQRADYDDAVRASDLDAADFDGDGAVDLLTANYYTIEVLWNDGTGAYQERSSIRVERGTRHASAGDFNGDGLADIVTTNDRSNRAWVYLNAGQRQFTDPISYNVGSVPSVVRVVDIEKDGDLDICTVNVGSGTVSILENNGNGIFPSSRTVATGLNSPAHLAVADFDLDGEADLAVASENSIMLLYGGDFTGRQSFEANAGELVVADLDGDGDDDGAARDDLAPCQALALRDGRWLGAHRGLSRPLDHARRLNPHGIHFCRGWHKRCLLK